MDGDEVMQAIQHGEARIVSALSLAMSTSSAAEKMTLNEARSFMIAYHVAMEASGTHYTDGTDDVSLEKTREYSEGYALEEIGEVVDSGDFVEVILNEDAQWAPGEKVYRRVSKEG